METSMDLETNQYREKLCVDVNLERGCMIVLPVRCRSSGPTRGGLTLGLTILIEEFLLMW